MVSTSTALVLFSYLLFQLSTASTINPIWLSPLNATNVGPASSVPRGEWTNSTIGSGSRSGTFATQVDSKGKIWILGGSALFYANAIWNYDPKTDLYRWVAGSADSDIELSIVSEFGVPNATAFPGSMNLGAYTIDHQDNIWIYGGDSGDLRSNNMFWRFNTSSFEFTNFRLNDTHVPMVGKTGVPSADNYPGSLERATLLVDSHNNLWLLGGYRYVSDIVVNEVWHFNTTSFQWTFAWGQLDTAVTLDYQNKIWNGRYAPGAVIDTEDRIWLFGGSGQGVDEWGDMWSFDTMTLQWRVEWGNETSLQTTASLAVPDAFDINNYPASRYSGAGMVDRQDGTLLVGGGVTHFASYSNDYWLFNKTSKLWKFVYGNLTSGVFVPTEFTHYRSPGSYLGSRWNSGVSGGIHNHGNFILCGGDDDVNYFSDIWIFPQDQCVGANNDCDVNAACTVSSDDYFSRICTCNEGYVGDGKTCNLPTPPSASSPSNNPSSNNNGNPSNSPSSKVSETTKMTCSLLVYLATLVVPFL